ncbi:MAG: hypothetical protein VX289_10010 [Candidatus Poribacteria bacterium]|nr:hypothetical protein [Candidatus Poribacteria bacterium]
MVKQNFWSTLNCAGECSNFKPSINTLQLLLNVFADIGRVWENSLQIGFHYLHPAKEGELRLIWNENFVIALDVGNSVIKYDKQDSKETGVYLGLGYLY